MTQPDDNYPPQVQKARRHIENGLGSLLDEFERQRLAAERAQGRAREARALSRALAAELGAPFVLRIADAELRIPRHPGHRSTLMADSIPR